MEDTLALWIFAAIHEIGGAGSPRQVVDQARAHHADVGRLRLARKLWDMRCDGTVDFVSMDMVRIMPGVSYELPNGELHGHD